MSFDYFYGPDDAEQYSFYRIPKRLITGDEFQETSTEAKLLYGLMLDRLQLSIRNQWLDSLKPGHYDNAAVSSYDCYWDPDVSEPQKQCLQTEGGAGDPWKTVGEGADRPKSRRFAHAYRRCQHPRV